jgi:hypothetical protein
MTATTNAATIEHTIGERGRFTLRVPSGDIRVRGVDGEVARVRDLDGHSLSDRFQIETGEGSLSLRAPDGINLLVDLSFLRKGHSADLEIDVPHHAIVQLETASADIEADRLLGETRIRTASGELMLTAAGGSIDIEAVSGDVQVTGDLPMSVACRTVSGDVAVEAPKLSRFQAKTTSGDIRVTGELKGDGPFSVDTVSGDALVVTPTGLRVESKTVAGEITTPERWKSEGGRGTRAFSIGGGEIPFAFRSISGDLTINAPKGTSSSTEPSIPPMAPIPPTAPVPPLAPVAPMAEDDSVADARLEVLKALERGEITIEDATAKLAAIDDEAGR